MESGFYVAGGRVSELAGYASGPGATLTKEPLMCSALQEVEQLLLIAQGIRESLHDTRHRVFGPWASPASQSAGAEPMPPSQEQQLSSAFARLRASLLEARDNASAIGSQL